MRDILSPGQLWDGQYQIVRCLGVGGTSAVYQAIQVTLSRPVAIKVITELAGDATLAERLVNEGKMLSRLSNKGIVTIFGAHIFGSTPYLVSEFVDGETLRSYLTRGAGKLDWRAAAAYIQQLCDALSHAHECGIVHRDLKPENVMVVIDGDALQLKILDFGFARMLGANWQSLTLTGQVNGTAQYMSPEQFKGEACKDTADIYSLGCILFEMVTGRQPFGGANPSEIANKHIHEPIPTIRESHVDAPGDLDRIISACMAKEPAHRYQSCAELSKNIQRLLDGQAVVTPVVRTSTLSNATAALVIGVAAAIGVVFFALSDPGLAHPFAWAVTRMSSSPARDLESAGDWFKMQNRYRAAKLLYDRALQYSTSLSPSQVQNISSKAAEARRSAEKLSLDLSRENRGSKSLDIERANYAFAAAKQTFDSGRLVEAQALLEGLLEDPAIRNNRAQLFCVLYMVSEIYRRQGNDAKLRTVLSSFREVCLQAPISAPEITPILQIILADKTGNNGPVLSALYQPLITNHPERSSDFCRGLLLSAIASPKHPPLEVMQRFIAARASDQTCRTDLIKLACLYLQLSPDRGEAIKTVSAIIPKMTTSEQKQILDELRYLGDHEESLQVRAHIVRVLFDCIPVRNGQYLNMLNQSRTWLEADPKSVAELNRKALKAIDNFEIEYKQGDVCRALTYAAIEQSQHDPPNWNSFCKYADAVQQRVKRLPKDDPERGIFLQMLAHQGTRFCADSNVTRLAYLRKLVNLMRDTSHNSGVRSLSYARALAIDAIFSARVGERTYAQRQLAQAELIRRAADVEDDPLFAQARACLTNPSTPNNRSDKRG